MRALINHQKGQNMYHDFYRKRWYAILSPEYLRRITEGSEQIAEELHQYIISEITQNRFYYNKRLVFYNGTKQYAYVLTLFDKEYIDIYKDIYTNGSLLLCKQFLIKVCIIWKDFLSDSFFDCLKCEACEQCQQKSQV